MDDDAVADAILAALAARGPGKSVCPSEPARALAADWRPLMPRVRETAARLAREGRLVVTQKGGPADALTARGPIRLRAPD